MPTEQISFFVAGIPQSRGSKRAFPFKRQDGGLGVAVSDDNPKSRDWMAQVADVAGRAMAGREPFRGAVRVDLTFCMPRPKAHFRSGRYANELREDAPDRHTKKPDRGKLARGVEDALTGIVYVDDSQVWTGRIEKVYDNLSGVHVAVTVECEDEA